MNIVIKEVTGKKELRQFVRFNIDLYKGNPYHVPSLIYDEMMTLDRKQNPAFEVCDAIYFLAYKGDRIGQGRENAKKYLADNPAVFDEVEQLVRNKYLNPEIEESDEPEEAPSAKVTKEKKESDK